MAAKKKNGAEVQFGDFDLDKVDVERIRNERAGAAERVATFNQSFTPTGDAFKDTGRMSGTSRDVKSMRQADLLLDKASDRGATVRGQDIQLELGQGELGIAQTRNTLFGKQIDDQMKLGSGELDINKAVLGMQQDRYNNVTRPADKLAMAERAATARVGTAEAGFELSDDLFKETSKYLKDGKPAEVSAVATPTTVALDPLTARTNIPQSSGYEPYPDILEAAPITNYGAGVLSQLGGSAVEGVKLIGRTAARIGRLDPLSPSRRYKRKVNK